MLSELSLMISMRFADDVARLRHRHRERLLPERRKSTSEAIVKSLSVMLSDGQKTILASNICSNILENTHTQKDVYLNNEKKD